MLNPQEYNLTPEGALRPAQILLNPHYISTAPENHVEEPGVLRTSTD